MQTTIISLGGSLIVPDQVDVPFLKKFRGVVLSVKNKRFIIVCGGGGLARKYQQAAQNLGVNRQTELDMIGTFSTKLNAELVRSMFLPHAHPEIIDDPNSKVSTSQRIVVCSGWKPGFSTDMVSVMLAKNFKAERIINLTNVDYVYDQDPRKYRNAKPIKKISWKDFFKIIGEKWKPGMHQPFDPVASRLAKKHGIETVIINGRKLTNFKNLLAGKKFTGTVIS